MIDGLTRAVLFAGLSESALADLRRISSPFAIAGGEVLFRQGDPPTGLYVVKSGALEIAARIPGDEDAAVSRILPGEVVGEFAMLDPGPRSARVTAAEPISGLFIPARTFIAMLEEGRGGAIEAIDRLRTLVATRTRATIERLAHEETVITPSELRSAPLGGIVEATTFEFEALRSLGRYAPFADAPGAAFLAQGAMLAASRGAPLDAGDRTLFIVRGAVRAAFERGAAQEQLTIHGPGEWAGLVAAIDGGPQRLALSAAEDSLLFAVPHAVFARWRERPGEVEQAVLAGVDRQLVKDQRRANRHLGRALALARFNAAAERAA